MKYLKTWMGVTSGSHLGREDGYPEQKTRIISSMDELRRTFDKEAKYYKLEPVEVGQAVQAMNDLT